MERIFSETAIDSTIGVPVAKTTGILFDKGIENLKERNDIDADVAEFIRRSIQIVVEFEVCYKFHIKNRSNPQVESFQQEVDRIARVATELAVIANVRGYDNVESLPATPVEGSTEAVNILAENLTGALDTVESEEDVEELYHKVTTSRETIKTIANVLDEQVSGLGE